MVARDCFSRRCERAGDQAGDARSGRSPSASADSRHAPGSRGVSERLASLRSYDRRSSNSGVSLATRGVLCQLGPLATHRLQEPELRVPEHCRLAIGSAATCSRLTSSSNSGRTGPAAVSQCACSSSSRVDFTAFTPRRRARHAHTERPPGESRSRGCILGRAAHTASGTSPGSPASASGRTR